ncbi:MAG: pirin family protein [Planctomycetota bacterium]
MITIRRANDRGHADHGWLNSYHTFSFASYRDPQHMGFRSLRVMNEDRVAPGQGFGTHAHDNMEIVSYVLEGQLEHKDSMGNGEILTPGEFQRISAGTGIQHSEFNPSSDDPVHFYQIWLIPTERDIEPSYEQKRFPDDQLRAALRLVASPDAAEDSIKIHTDTRVYLSKMEEGEHVVATLVEGRHAWLQVLRGSVSLDGRDLQVGDAAAVSDTIKVEVESRSDSEIMLFDLA